jgi:hypothetical protein
MRLVSATALLLAFRLRRRLRRLLHQLLHQLLQQPPHHLLRPHAQPENLGMAAHAQAYVSRDITTTQPPVAAILPARVENHGMVVRAHYPRVLLQLIRFGAVRPVPARQGPAYGIVPMAVAVAARERLPVSLMDPPILAAVWL